MPIADLRPQAVRRSPDDLLRHLRSFRFDLRFSAGVWFFSPPASRFHERYGPALDIRQRLDVAASLADSGLAAIEAHYPNEVNEENADTYRAFTRDTGIRLLTIVPLLFYGRRFEFGSLSSPIEADRREAIALATRAFALNREFDTEFAVVWPGIDGYENPFGLDLAAARARFAEGLAEAMDAVPGVRVAFEPKPYEPRGRILYGTTPEGVLLGRQVEALLSAPENRGLLDEGHALCAMNPEVGHALMAGEDLPYAFSWPLSEGRLAHLHLNSQPLGNFDQDLNVGVVAPEQLEALLYVLMMHGYRGHFGIDINPERMPVATALRISMDAVRAAAGRLEDVDHESVLFAANHPDRARGWLEAYLVRLRARHPDRLSPLPPLSR
jgi:xylose isomerase